MLTSADKTMGAYGQTSWLIARIHKRNTWPLNYLTVVVGTQQFIITSPLYIDINATFVPIN